MPLVDKSFRGLYVALFSIFVLFGMSMTIIGATLPRILSDFGWDYTTAGAVIAAGAIGYFLATYAAGFLVARIGPRATILSGLVLVVAGLSFFAATPSAPLNLLLNLAIGIGQGFIELTVNWATLRMDRKGTGRAMNLMHGAFAAGAFAGPFAIGLLLGAALPWTLVYRGIAVLFVVVAAAIACLPFGALKAGAAAGTSAADPAPAQAAAAETVPRVLLAKQPAYWLGFGALLLYVGVELGISNWIAEYFVTIFGADVAMGSFMVSLFWGGLLLGRFGFPLFLKNARRDLQLLSMAGLMGASVIGLAAFGLAGVGEAVIVPAAVFVLLAGLGCSIIYPTVVTFIGGIFPAVQSQAVAFASMGGGIGAFAFPYLMANVSAAWGLGAGFAVYAFFAVLTIIACAGIVGAAAKAARA